MILVREDLPLVPFEALLVGARRDGEPHRIGWSRAAAACHQAARERVAAVARVIESTELYEGHRSTRRNGGTEVRPFDWPPKAACRDVIFVAFVVTTPDRFVRLRSSVPVNPCPPSTSAPPFTHRRAAVARTSTVDEAAAIAS